MEAKRSEAEKTGRTFDSAYTFSFSIALGLILFIGGLVISLTLGEGTSLGLIFGIPLLLAGLVIPLIMLRDFFSQNEIVAPCPYCSAQIKTSDSTLKLQCPACKGIVVVHDMKLQPLKE
jgi:hypothetical protein